MICVFLNVIIVFYLQGAGKGCFVFFYGAATQRGSWPPHS